MLPAGVKTDPLVSQRKGTRGAGGPMVYDGRMGWWLYPKLQRYMSEQDCIATGRTNCQ